jgi:NADPH-dependent 2,4-dienoyl-CoA reductase/sulfur reductase-like enzyme
MKEVVNVPVMAAGRINDPALADSIVAENRADLVAMGRAFLADPYFPIKASRGDLEGIRKCTACCTCFDAGMQSLVNSRGDGAVVCAVNAELGREAENLVQPTAIVKKILVVGGGPAGMEAARVASLRGHDVTLWEVGVRLGGTLLVATVPPYKQELGCLLEFLTTQLQRLAVRVELGKLASAQDIIGHGFDEIIVATGGRPIKPNMPGIDSQNVTASIEVLQGRQTGQKVLVVGGGMVGCETAEFLKAQGKMVTIVEALNKIAADVGPTTRWVLVARIKRSGIEVLAETTLVGITQKGALVEYQGRSDELQADTIVLAMGMTPERQLLEELEKMGVHPHTVGDCTSVGKIMQAVHAGWEVGCKV